MINTSCKKGDWSMKKKKSYETIAVEQSLKEL